jgi:hydroxymethylpyrimidine synthase
LHPKIAAHAADIAKGIKGAADWDNAMSKSKGRSRLGKDV